MDRRKFIAGGGMALAAGTLTLSCESDEQQFAEANDVESDNSSPGQEEEVQDIDVPSLDEGDWESVRAQFRLSPDRIHYTLFLLASNPAVVREAISQHRRKLNEQPATYLEEQNNTRRQEVRQAAGNYLGESGDEIALTDSTTMGIGLVYNGLMLQADDEVITTEHDYYSTHASLQFTAERTGASVRRISLYDNPADVTEEEVIGNIEDAVGPDTRVLALTWVHSMNGVKLPIGAISEVVDDINSGRDPGDRLLICVDGVHGFGIENVTMSDLGCDFFMAGAHKWLFGPRGTGIVWGHPDAWAATRPIIPTFSDTSSWDAWSQGRDMPDPTTAARMTPGGFKPFEHQWAMTQAFQFHQQIGKERVAERTHELARQVKEGMAEMQHIQVHTPLADDLSSGMVCFDVDGLSPNGVRNRLRSQNIMATVTPYRISHARIAPTIINTQQEIESTLEALRGLA